MKTSSLFLAISCFVLALTTVTARGEDPNTILGSFIKEHDTQTGLFATPPKQASIDRFFSADLAALFKKDLATSVKTGEVGVLDFDILYFSQDPQIKKLKIEKAAIGGVLKHEGDEPIDGLATIEMSFTDSGKDSRTVFQFGQNNAKEWKIDDIHFNDGSSLKELLEKAYPVKNAR